ncbi:MAG: VTT domain-containing protein [Thermoleophilaceae bacterium]
MSEIRRHRNALAVAAAVLAVVVLYMTGVIPRIPDPKKVIEDLARGLGPWTYALVGLLAFLETGAFVGLFAPGETVVMVGGVIAGQGEISLVPLIGLVWVCAVAGDTASFFIGRRLGREFVLRHGAKVKITEERLESVEAYFEHHGGKTILIGRFVGLIRALAPFVAGSSGFPYRRFVPFSVIGCGLWGTLYCVLGYIFWRSFDQVAAIAGKATLAFAIVVFVVVAVVFAYRRLRRPEGRRRLVGWADRQGRRPALRPFYTAAGKAWRGIGRPLVGAVAPRLRFLWERLTPGELSLELTTTAAVAGVGLYVFFTLYTEVIGSGTRLIPADQGLLDLADRLHVAVAVDVLKVVTDLGASPTVATLLVITCIALGTRGHFTEVSALLVGALLLFVGVQLAKAGVDRPRPPMPLTAARGSSFPSGHAAYSTVWVAVAVVVARALPGRAGRAVLVGAGLVVCAVVGFSRIYLRVHYWSDVAAGWALGAGALGACAAIAPIVDHIRNNGSEHRSPSQAT